MTGTSPSDTCPSPDVGRTGRMAVSDTELHEWMERRRNSCAVLENVPDEATVDARSSPKKRQRSQRLCGRLSARNLAEAFDSDKPASDDEHISEDNASDYAEERHVATEGPSMAMSCLSSSDQGFDNLAIGDFRRAPDSCFRALHAMFAPLEKCPSDSCLESDSVVQPDSLGCIVGDGTCSILGESCPMVEDGGAGVSQELLNSTSLATSVQGEPSISEPLLASSHIAASSDALDEIEASQTHHADGTFIVCVDRTGGEPLGVDIECVGDGTPFIVESITSGLIETWNTRHPNEQVRCGDRLIEANGISDPWDLIATCKSKSELKLRFWRREDDSRARHPDAFRLRYAADSCGRAQSSCTATTDLAEQLTRADAQHQLGARTCEDPAQRRPNTTVNESHGISQRWQSRVSHRVTPGVYSFSVPAQFSQKVQRGLLYVKDQAQRAPAAISEQVSQRAQKGLNLAKRLGKMGGA